MCKYKVSTTTTTTTTTSVPSSSSSSSSLQQESSSSSSSSSSSHIDGVIVKRRKSKRQNIDKQHNNCICSCCPLRSLDRHDIKTIQKQFKQSIKSNNNSYLLQRCIRYDWDSVLVCCLLIIDIFDNNNNNTITNTSTSSSSTTTTKKIQRVVEAGKKQLLARDRFGNTPLHISCYHRPPLCIVTAILEAASKFPSSSSSSSFKIELQQKQPYQIHTMVNNKNLTPLGIACSAGANLEIIEELLYPRYNGLINGGHYVTEMSDSTTTTTTTTTTNSTNNNDSTSPISGLVRRYEMMQKSKHEGNSIPLSTITTIPTSTSTNNNNDKNNSKKRSNTNNNIDSPVFTTFWNKIDILIQAAWFADCYESSSKDNYYSSISSIMDDDDDDNFQQEYWQLRNSFHSLLHGAAYISESIPPILTDVFIRCYPEMISSSSNNNNENIILPLHLAIAISPTTNTKKQLKCQHYFRRLYQRNYFITKLLQFDPSTATCIVPGTNGRYPLFVAIASNLPWHIYNNNSNQENNVNYRNKSRSSTTTITVTNSTTTTNESKNNRIMDGNEKKIGNNVNKDHDTKQQMMDDNDDNDNLLVGPIQLLWKCAPDILNQQDPITGLFPFMLAATTTSSIKNVKNEESNHDCRKEIQQEQQIDDDDENSLQQLDTIYSLLRLAPYQVGSSTSSEQ